MWLVVIDYKNIMDITCQDCKKVFSRSDSLKRHKNHKHSHVKMKPQTAIEWSAEKQKEIRPLEKWWEHESILPFRPCSSMNISGCSNSGKTTWVFKLLKHLNGMYVENPPKHVLYCYGVYQPLFNEMETVVPNLTFHEGLPSSNTLEELTTDKQHKMVILDDLMDQVTQSHDMELLFTRGCHHKNLSVIFINQNLYQQGKSARTIALNTQYLVLFRNMRDASQIAHMSRQIFPGHSNILTEIYQDCTKKPYSYLVIDMSPQSQDKYRLRTNIFPGEDPLVYVPNTQ